MIKINWLVLKHRVIEIIAIIIIFTVWHELPLFLLYSEVVVDKQHSDLGDG